MKKYNIGLDIGTTSVGWAVVECNKQKIMRKGNRQLWGVRLFEEANTAEARRMFRSTRRRYDRRRERIRLLQEEFKEEMNKVDSNFFIKLKESKFKETDTKNKTIFLSDEERKLIKNYNSRFKTIYHLRQHLMNSNEKEDIRLIYLAMHHIIKYRGNFNHSNDKNFNIENLNIKEGLINLFNNYFSYINSEYFDDYNQIIDLDEFANALEIQDRNDMKIKIKSVLLDSGIFDNKMVTEFQKMFLGNKFNVGTILSIESNDKDLSNLSISLNGDDLDNQEKMDKIEELCGNKIEIIYTMKELYDSIFLKKLFSVSGINSISSLMVYKYDKYNEQLKNIKLTMKKDKKIFKEFFKGENCIYNQYVCNKLTSQEFAKKVNDAISKIGINETFDESEFLPKITSTENGKYPYQLNKNELEEIIKKQSKYYPFLENTTSTGELKIVKLLEFKIPYYVGPLKNNENIKGENHFAWIIKNSNEKVTPYNFDEVVNKEATAEKFITRMISKCTYLIKENALPNNSILYCKFKVMNELKQIKINGERIDNDMQHKIIDELFLKVNGKISNKKFKDYLLSSNYYSMYPELNVTGYSADDAFANNIQPYIDFFGDNGIFKDTNYTENDAEKIIEWITIFEDKSILENKVRNTYPLLNDKAINEIKKKKYKGWGNLSKKLLTEKYYVQKDSNVKKSILDLMYESKDNFMQILNDKEYKFQDMIKEINNFDENISKLSYDVINELSTSPANKRGIYQALCVLDEIISFIGYQPENIMIEMARSDEKKERKDDRKKYLEKLYDKCKSEINDYNSLKSKLKESTIDNEKMYLYFIQEGKCLYSGKSIDINNLNSGEYEVDHIIPRTLIKDNSIDNKALVCRECNQEKAANYVLPKEYINKNIEWWKHLRKIGLISAKKFYKLTRKEYKDEDIEVFINRQLVETRQITKHVANIISSLYKKPKVVYLKANLSHNYRDKFELYKFRDINDYHHAHDAYLAAVLGEYKEKYLKFDVNFDFVREYNQKLRESKNYKKLSYGYVINSLDNDTFNVFSSLTQKYFDNKTGELLFNVKEFNDRVENTLYRNDIMVSRKSEIRTGMMYKQTIKPKEDGLVRLKKDMPTGLYGGYTNVETTYLSLVKYKEKIKLIGIPYEIALKSKNDINAKNDFIIKTLKLKNYNEFIIIKDFIPYETEMIIKKHNVYIKGYSTSKKTCEVSNAIQLKLSKYNQKRWKRELNFCLNILNPEKYLLTIENIEAFKNNLKDIINELFNLKNKFPLFMNEIEKIQNQIELDSLNILDYRKIIRELFTIYHCNSKNGNLKEYGLGDRIGRLSGYNISTGTIITKSVTGIRERKYEF